MTGTLTFSLRWRCEHNRWSQRTLPHVSYGWSTRIAILVNEADARLECCLCIEIHKETETITDVNEAGWIPWRKYNLQVFYKVVCSWTIWICVWSLWLIGSELPPFNISSNVKNIKKLSELELKRNLKTSWHDQYKGSAWIFVGGLPYDLTEGDVICVFSQ